MLKKLLKQEIKSQGKVMLGIYAVLAAATALVSVLGLIGGQAGGVAGGLAAAGEGFYLITVMMLFVACYIYLCMHFYQSMFTAQGYLTHTLPVKESQILHAKLFVSAGFLFLTMAAVAVMFFLFGCITQGVGLSQLTGAASEAFATAGKELEVPGAVLALFVIVLAVCGCFVSLLIFFAGCSIGQLAKRSKGVCGIAAGIGLYYLAQIGTMLLLVPAAFVYAERLDTQGGTVEIVRWAMAGAILLLLFWIAVFYSISRVIVQKHLNLE